MVALALFATLWGAVLAFRFKVFALYPTIAVGWVAVGCVALISGLALWPTLQAMLIVTVAPQGGFLTAALGRTLIARARALSRRRRMDERQPQTQSA